MFPSSDHPETLPIPDDKGKGRAYESGRLLSSNAKVSLDSVHSSKSSSIISPIIDRKGKGRAYEPGQPRLIPVDYKGKGRAYEPEPTIAAVNQDSVAPPQSSFQSNFSSSPLTRPVYRNRKHAMDHISDAEDEEKVSRNIKRLRRLQTPVQEVDMDVIILSSDDDSPSVQKANSNAAVSLFSDDDSSDFIVPDSSRPSSPPPAVLEVRENIRHAIRRIMKDPAAREKSKAQMDALIAVMTEDRDVMVAMKTGGGKSMLWMVPSAMDDEAKSIVVCPFVALLEEQYAKAVATGLRCHNYSRSKEVPDNVQILFVQVEHCSSEAFARYECQSRPTLCSRSSIAPTVSLYPLSVKSSAEPL
jgi:hypothetical protein